MGKLLHVGWLHEMREIDAGQYCDAKREFAAVNKALRAAKVPTYTEPHHLPDDSWGFKLYPSNGIAFVQRLAAYLEDDEPEWPPPGDPDTMDNPLDDEMVEDAGYMLDTLTFQHLILHDPSWGYWVPVDFPDVVFPNENLGVGAMIGSSVRLKAECEQIAELLKLPLKLDPEDAAVREAMLNPGKGRTRWKKYGVESHNLLALHRACERSLATGAAIYVT